MLRLTRAQVREVDRRSIQDYHIPGIVLMENAAQAATRVALRMIDDLKRPVLIVCGGGNNGGDGLAITRHLHNQKLNVQIHLATDPAKFTGDALINWQIVQAMQIPLSWTNKPSLIIDALFGTGLSQAPRPDAAKLIDRMNKLHDRAIPTLAIDLPSGLDCDSGNPLGDSCIRATRTITFVAEKAGFANPESKPYVGKVTVGDIGCPAAVIEAVVRSSGSPSLNQ